MESYVLRVWLPDRPGALGAVASRIGAVKGDVVGIEILETGAGQAVDELVVQLPDATLVDLLVSEVRQVDGVQVEEVRSVGPDGHDPRRATLETAGRLVEARDRDGLLAVARDVRPRGRCRRRGWPWSTSTASHHRWSPATGPPARAGWSPSSTAPARRPSSGSGGARTPAATT